MSLIGVRRWKGRYEKVIMSTGGPAAGVRRWKGRYEKVIMPSGGSAAGECDMKRLSCLAALPVSAGAYRDGKWGAVAPTPLK